GSADAGGARAGNGARDDARGVARLADPKTQRAAAAGKTAAGVLAGGGGISNWWRERGRRARAVRAGGMGDGDADILCRIADVRPDNGVSLGRGAAGIFDVRASRAPRGDGYS